MPKKYRPRQAGATFIQSTCRLPEDLDARVAAEAEHSDCSFNAALIEILEVYFKRRKPRNTLRSTK